MELWEVFSQLKDHKDVSIADIANATGLPYTTVDSIIKKKLKDIKYGNAQKIADYFYFRYCLLNSLGIYLY